MKTYKPNTYGFSIKSFGLQNKTYLSTTIMLFFDLNDPGSILREQELWSTLPAQLGADTFPDMGFPKPHAEFLVSGSCFSPKSQPVPASEVKVKIGNLQKKLLVFGQRKWQPGGIPSSPQPFIEMELNWRNSFGGSGYDANPLGKGFEAADDGLWLLPNIEDQRQLIGSPKDRPQPAGLAPLNMMWPQRFGKCGTYDGNWLEDRWPWFPDDFNAEFFNTAPQDQYLTGFFQGEERIEISNMHPHIPLIQSRLPGQRPRCFITRKKELGPKAETEFIELHHKIDTVWLFPAIMRGLLLYRGTMEVLDDEYGDIERIYIAAESMAEPEKSIEHYWQEQQEFWDRSVDIDMAPLDNAKGKVADMLKKMRQLPKQIKQARLKATGKAPRMQRTPAETAAKAHQTLADSRKNLLEQEAMTRKMQAKYGHLMEIDLGIFARMHQTLKNMANKADQTLATAEKTQKKGGAMKADLTKLLKEKIPAEDLAKAGINSDDMLAVKKSNPWHERGFPQVIEWRKNLEQNLAAREELSKLGFQPHTIKRGWLGFNSYQRLEQMTDWAEEEDELSLPTALIMPRFSEATLTAVRLRPNLRSAQKDILIPGSAAPPLFLPALEPKSPLVIISDELEARLLEQETGDFCSVLAMSNATDKLDELSLEAIENCSSILIIFPADIKGRAKELKDWQQVFNEIQAVFLPPGMDIYEVHKKPGLRPWLLSQLPAEIARDNNVDISLPKAGKLPDAASVASLAIPSFDTKSIVKEFGDELKKFHQPKINQLENTKKEVEAKVREKIIKAGLEPDAIMKPKAEARDYAKLGKKAATKILAQKDRLKAKGVLSLADEKKMTKEASQLIKLGEEGEKQYQAGMQKLASAKTAIAALKAGEIPNKLKAAFSARGIDPEQLKKLTREEVQARYDQGLSLAGANIGGLDLSEMDLSGADLSKTLCQKTVFKNCRLRGTRFYQTLAQEADFSGADLGKCDMDKAVMTKAKFIGARLDGCEIKKSTLMEADLSCASIKESRIYMSIMEKTILSGTIFDNSELKMSAFSDAKASKASFAGAQIKKCLFKRTVLDQVDFSGASMPQTMLHGVHGEGVSFNGADLSRVRMAGDAQFPLADFTNITMNQGSLIDSNLAGANFLGARLNSCLIENCNLTKADLTDISAKNSRFKRSNLELAKMSGINLYGGSLKKARLVGTDLSFANLFAVDFFKCVMGNTRLDGANLKRTILYKRKEFLK